MTAWHRVWLILGTYASMRLQDALWPMSPAEMAPWWIHALFLIAFTIGIWRTA